MSLRESALERMPIPLHESSDRDRDGLLGTCGYLPRRSCGRRIAPSGPPRQGPPGRAQCMLPMVREGATMFFRQFKVEGLGRYSYMIGGMTAWDSTQRRSHV